MATSCARRRQVVRAATVTNYKTRPRSAAGTSTSAASAFAPGLDATWRGAGLLVAHTRLPQQNMPVLVEEREDLTRSGLVVRIDEDEWHDVVGEREAAELPTVEQPARVVAHHARDDRQATEALEARAEMVARTLATEAFASLDGEVEIGGRLPRDHDHVVVHRGSRDARGPHAVGDRMLAEPRLSFDAALDHVEQVLARRGSVAVEPQAIVGDGQRDRRRLAQEERTERHMRVAGDLLQLLDRRLTFACEPFRPCTESREQGAGISTRALLRPFEHPRSDSDGRDHAHLLNLLRREPTSRRGRPRGSLWRTRCRTRADARLLSPAQCPLPYPTQLLQAFAGWLMLRDDDSVERDEAHDAAEALGSMLSFAFSRGLGLADADDLPELVDMLLDGALEDDADRPSAEQMQADQLLLADFAAFRSAVATEHGDEEAAAAWQAAADATLQLVSQSVPLDDAMAAESDLEPDVLLARLDATPLVSAIRPFLEWLGTGRAIADSGGLRRADIEPVAAMLGVQAVGSARRSESGDDTVRVTSMWQLPALAAFWRTLVLLGVVELTATRARPGSAAPVWLETGDIDDDDAVREIVVSAYVAELLLDDTTDDPRTWDGVGFHATVHALVRAIACQPNDQEALHADPRCLAAMRTAGLIVDSPDDVPMVPEGLRTAVGRGATGATAQFDAIVGGE